MFDNLDGMMRALAVKNNPWKEELFFTVKLTQQLLSKYYTEVTPKTGMLLISGNILNPFRKLQSFRMWDNAMDINCEDETSYTTRYQEVFLKYMKSEHCAKHWWELVNELQCVPSGKLVPSEMAFGFCQSSFDPYNLSSNDEEYLTPNNVAETTLGQCNHAAQEFSTTRLYMNSPPNAPWNRGQNNSNLNDYHADPIEISGTFWIQDITNRWRPQDDTHFWYAHICNVVRDIVSIIPGVQNGSGSPGSCPRSVC
jgi:hypothetical protein